MVQKEVIAVAASSLEVEVFWLLGAEAYWAVAEDTKVVLEEVVYFLVAA